MTVHQRGSGESRSIITTGDFTDFGNIGSPTGAATSTNNLRSNSSLLPIQGSSGINAQIEAALNAATSRPQTTEKQSTLEALQLAEKSTLALYNLIRTDTPERNLQVVMGTVLSAVKHLLLGLIPQSLESVGMDAHGSQYQIPYGQHGAMLYAQACGADGLFLTLDLIDDFLRTGHQRIVIAPFKIVDGRVDVRGLHLSYHLPIDASDTRKNVINIATDDEPTADAKAVYSLAMHACKIARGALQATKIETL